jgi:DNA polymerase III subunit epsilon
MLELQSKVSLLGCPVYEGLSLDRESFIALDVETANAEISSICQIALVRFVAGEAIDVWHSFVDPGEPFSAWNVALHGIDAATVRNAPDFPAIMGTVSPLLKDMVVASHMPFDRVAIERACSKYCIPLVRCSWLDTARVARRAWPRFARKGYGLRSIASWCGIEFRHHDAVEDARTAGRILAQAIAETGIGVEKWLIQSIPLTLNNPRIQPCNRPLGTHHSRSSLKYTALEAKHFHTLSRISESRP